eukprot:GEMP01029970.1.p2 GENE.GEMP01029970.1~~GEMP01029970.1.p2  ORF type:complete len:116 (-),score=21.62 GEMP01029970.1:779-1126(-)
MDAQAKAVQKANAVYEKAAMTAAKAAAKAYDRAWNAKAKAYAKAKALMPKQPKQRRSYTLRVKTGQAASRAFAKAMRTISSPDPRMHYYPEQTGFEVANELLGICDIVEGRLARE